MDLNNIYRTLLEPKTQEGFKKWFLQEDVKQFLTEEANEDYIILSAYLHSDAFIHSVFVPKSEIINEDSRNDLLKWSDPISSWILGYETISSPLSNNDSEILKNTGEQIVFTRSSEAINNNKPYYELSQKLCQTLAVHFCRERNVWCRWDELGEPLDVFKIIKKAFQGRKEKSVIICAKKEVFANYARAGNFILVRMFKFVRHRTRNFDISFAGQKPINISNSDSIFGSIQITSDGEYSHSKGIQLLKFEDPERDKIRKESQEYQSFKAYDRKTKKNSMISCDRRETSGDMGNSLPYELNPVFFNSKVLYKYKADSIKYELEHNSLSCGNSWGIQAFHINTAGQVYTFLKYLRELPFKEQEHWKKYNEEADVFISDEAFQMDDINPAIGDFYEKDDPLLRLKNKLNKLDSDGSPWWTVRDSKEINEVYYPCKNTKNEWAEDILNLNKLLVEGFETEELREKADNLKKERLREKRKELGRKSDYNGGSLKLLGLILLLRGYDEERAKEIMEPFHTVHSLRSKVKAHSWGDEAEELHQKALKDHDGSHRDHFKKICSDCDESLDVLIEEFSNL